MPDSYREAVMFSDSLRLGANFLLAPLMWILASVPQFTDWGRSASEFSEQNDSLLVPFGLAFSIWFPIFILCIGYGFYQALPKNRIKPVYRRIGHWTAFGFLGVCLWALLSAHASKALVLPLTAFVFVPTVYCLIRALRALVTIESEPKGTEKIFCTVGIGLIAGWTSLAMFLNWTPLIGQVTGLAEVPLCLFMLVLALVFILSILRQLKGLYAYAFPSVWGLLWLGFERYRSGIAFETIGSLALLGAIAILISAYYLNTQKENAAR